MSQLVEMNQQPVVTPDQSNSLLAIISRAASDPSVDIDKMERLMTMHMRMVANDAKKEYFTDLANMQAELPAVAERGKISGTKKDGSDFSSGSYAKLEDIVGVAKPFLHKYGFAMSFRVTQDGPMITTTGVLSHKGGHSEQTSISLPADTSGSKNAVQSIGSSNSYGKRYVLCDLLNIVTAGQDNDGNAATPVSLITENQREQLVALLVRLDEDEQNKFLGLFGGVAFIEKNAFNNAHADLIARNKRAASHANT